MGSTLGLFLPRKWIASMMACLSSWPSFNQRDYSQNNGTYKTDLKDSRRVRTFLGTRGKRPGISMRESVFKIPKVKRNIYHNRLYGYKPPEREISYKDRLSDILNTCYNYWKVGHEMAPKVKQKCEKKKGLAQISAKKFQPRRSRSRSEPWWDRLSKNKESVATSHPADHFKTFSWWDSRKECDLAFRHVDLQATVDRLSKPKQRPPYPTCGKMLGDDERTRLHSFDWDCADEERKRPSAADMRKLTLLELARSRPPPPGRQRHPVLGQGYVSTSPGRFPDCASDSSSTLERIVSTLSSWKAAAGESRGRYRARGRSQLPVQLPKNVLSLDRQSRDPLSTGFLRKFRCGQDRAGLKSDCNSVFPPSPLKAPRRVSFSVEQQQQQQQKPPVVERAIMHAPGAGDVGGDVQKPAHTVADQGQPPRSRSPLRCPLTVKPPLDRSPLAKAPLERSTIYIKNTEEVEGKPGGKAAKMSRGRSLSPPQQAKSQVRQKSPARGKDKVPGQAKVAGAGDVGQSRDQDHVKAQEKASFKSQEASRETEDAGKTSKAVEKKASEAPKSSSGASDPTAASLRAAPNAGSEKPDTSLGQGTRSGAASQDSQPAAGTRTGSAGPGGRSGAVAAAERSLAESRPKSASAAGRTSPAQASSRPLSGRVAPRVVSVARRALCVALSWIRDYGGTVAKYVFFLLLIGYVAFLFWDEIEALVSSGPSSLFGGAVNYFWTEEKQESPLICM